MRWHKQSIQRIKHTYTRTKGKNETERERERKKWIIMNVQSGMVFVLFVLPLSLVVSWPETNFRKWQVLRNRKDKLHDSVLMADTGKSVIFPWAILATDTQKDTERERRKKLYVVNEREEEKVEYRKCEILTDKTSFFPCCCWFWVEQRA